jgi:pimeloyl-ACP methyl ester carboxylesterase
MSSLHTTVLGDGVPAVFVHGSFGWGTETFPEQRALADDYRVVLVDRRGFGGSTFADAEGWPRDMYDLAELLAEIGPAHLVGQSYGAVVALLAAGLRPDRVLSLVAIEPPAFEVAAGDAAADKTIAALKPVFGRVEELTAREFITEWALAQGRTREQLEGWIGSFGEQDWAAVEASRHARWPGDAPFRFDELRAANFPKLLVRGAWQPEVVGRDDAGKDFAAVCERIAQQIGAASVVVFDRSTHNPQLQEPDAFNAFLRQTWAAVPPASYPGALVRPATT